MRLYGRLSGQPTVQPTSKHRLSVPPYVIGGQTNEQFTDCMRPFLIRINQLEPVFLRTSFGVEQDRGVGEM